MRFHLSFVPAALFAIIVKSLPQILDNTGSSDPGSIDPTFPGQSIASADVSDIGDAHNANLISANPINPNFSSQTIDNSDVSPELENLQDPSFMISQKSTATNTKYNVPWCCEPDDADGFVCSTCQFIYLYIVHTKQRYLPM